MALNGKTTPFFLTRKSVELVKPAEPTPSETLSFSTIDNNPHIEIICQTIYVYRPKFSVSITENGNHNTSYEALSDHALVFKEGLSRALVYYYPLAGKLKRQSDGTLRITCNTDGVPFAEATVDCSLDSLNYFDGIDAETAQPFVFDFRSNSEYGYHPLVLQVTKFSCGGFTVGMRLSHSVCDGFGAAQFFRAVAELARGESEPSVKPVWERERLVGIPCQDEDFLPFDMASLTKSPFIPAAQLCHGCFDIDAESIKQLKTRSTNEAGDEMTNEPFTTIEILGAYIWRSRCRALKQDPVGKTILHVALGIRNLVNPPLPAGYYGNAFASARVVITGQELDNEPLFKVAMLIKKSKKTASEADNIKKSLDFLEAFRRRDMKIDDSGASMVLTDWRRLKLLEEVDLGSRELVNMIPVPWNTIEFVSSCVFLPANRINPSMKGGVRVFVSLPGAAMTIFKQEMDALKIGTAIKS